MARKPISELMGGVTRFGRLTVVGEAPPAQWRHREYRRVLCVCDCGTERRVQPSKLKAGQTLSCGCYAAERASQSNRTHGMSRSPEYLSWVAMRCRCYNPADKSYADYGGRGITVCERWRDSFEAFFADMGPRPAGMTLDRIEVNRNYEPSNCRWADPYEQADNTRIARRLLVKGERINLSEASRRAGISRSSIRLRMKRGMSAEEAMSAPRDLTQGSRSKANNRHVEFRGKQMLMAEVRDATGIEGSHINYHLKRGRTVDEAVDFILSNRKRS